MGVLQAHFEWLEPHKTSAGAKLWDYPDLFRDVADALHDHGYHSHALRFFEPILENGLDADPHIHHRMATCYQGLGRVDDAENAFQMVLRHDEGNVDARVQLARIYEAQGKPDRAVVYVNEVIALEAKRHREKRAKRRRTGVDPLLPEPADTFLPPTRAPRASQRRKASHAGPDEQQQQQQAEQAREDAVRMQLTRVEALEEPMQSGDEGATDQWMEAAGVMIEDFRNAKIFYPMDRYIRFLGYSREARARASRPNGTAMTVLQALGERLQATLGIMSDPSPTRPDRIVDADLERKTKATFNRRKASRSQRAIVASNFRGGSISSSSTPCASLDGVRKPPHMRSWAPLAMPTSIIIRGMPCS